MKALKAIFYLLFIIAFFSPMAATIYLSQNPSDSLKALYVVVFKYFNLVYYALLIIFLFASFKFKEAVIGGIIFILGYFGFIYTKEFFLAKKHAMQKAKELNAQVLTLSELNNFGAFKLLYREGYYVVVKKTTYDHSSPFGYVKERRD